MLAACAEIGLQLNRPKIFGKIVPKLDPKAPLIFWRSQNKNAAFERRPRHDLVENAGFVSFSFSLSLSCVKEW